MTLYVAGTPCIEGMENNRESSDRA